MPTAAAPEAFGSQAAIPAEGTVLAFDYGERRIGVAVGELTLRIAHPLETVHAHSDDERLQRIEPLMREWAPCLLVVGLPRHLDDREHELAGRVHAFTARLERHFRVPARLVDETLSSHEASLVLREAGVRGRRQKALLDQAAAQQILETFFSMRHDAA